jgi:hypothetical protein
MRIHIGFPEISLMFQAKIPLLTSLIKSGLHYYLVNFLMNRVFCKNLRNKEKSRLFAAPYCDGNAPRSTGGMQKFFSRPQD